MSQSRASVQLLSRGASSGQGRRCSPGPCRMDCSCRWSSEGGPSIRGEPSPLSHHDGQLEHGPRASDRTRQDARKRASESLADVVSGGQRKVGPAITRVTVPYRPYADRLHAAVPGEWPRVHVLVDGKPANGMLCPAASVVAYLSRDA